jgi:hypothetical protein
MRYISPKQPAPNFRQLAEEIFGPIDWQNEDSEAFEKMT